MDSLRTRLADDAGSFGLRKAEREGEGEGSGLLRAASALDMRDEGRCGGIVMIVFLLGHMQRCEQMLHMGQIWSRRDSTRDKQVIVRDST